ncbi:MAG: hypothetical protein GY754_01455 [bacterium]|nr:hypothetical protein [bacterium]
MEQQNNKKRNNIPLVVSVIFNIVLVIIFFVGKNSSNNKGIEKKLDRILAIQNEMAINRYLSLKEDHEGDNSFSEANSNESEFGRAILRNEIKDILKKELPEIAKENGQSQEIEFDEKKKDPLESIPVSEQKTALANCNYVVDDAIKAGSWTAADAGRIRNNFQKMDREQQKSILQKIIPAMNRGEIKVEPGSEMF